MKLFVQSESTEPIWQMAWMNSLRGIQRNLLARGVSEKLLYTQELLAAPSVKDGQRVMCASSLKIAYPSCETYLI